MIDNKQGFIQRLSFETEYGREFEYKCESCNGHIDNTPYTTYYNGKPISHYGYCPHCGKEFIGYHTIETFGSMFFPSNKPPKHSTILFEKYKNQK